jgi:hypothetical protein
MRNLGNKICGDGIGTIRLAKIIVPSDGRFRTRKARKT